MSPSGPKSSKNVQTVAGSQVCSGDCDGATSTNAFRLVSFAFVCFLVVRFSRCKFRLLLFRFDLVLFNRYFAVVIIKRTDDILHTKSATLTIQLLE